jgi:hypothetical protein
MKKFVFLYRGIDERPGAREEWMAWFADHGASFVDSGGRLGPGRLVTAEGGSDLANDITGYSLVLAEDLAGAELLAATCPSAAGLEIYEALPM